MPAPEPLHAGDGGFVRRVATALAEFDRPRAICVAATMPRAEFVRDLIRRSGEIQPEHVDAVLSCDAAEAFEANRYHLVVLDASVDPASRADLTQRAKRRLPICKILEITAWLTDPPL